MYYKAPRIENKPQWVPIVAKNRDWLIGYVSGIEMIKSLVVDTLYDNGIDINLKGLDLGLDSSRFNDILENNKRESDCTEEEIKEYYKNIIEDKINSISNDHPDNDSSVFDDSFLEVECACGLGVYTFKESKEIPYKPFKCQICGRIIIDYTDHDDDDFEFDGKRDSRIDRINDEFKRREDEDEED